MKNDFDTMVNNIEKELLDLKTASEYSSVKSAYSTQISVTTGLYRITYQNTSEEVYSLVSGNPVNDNYGVAFARTPSSNTQVVEINTDEMTYPSPTRTSRMTVIANKPIISITRIS